VLFALVRLGPEAYGATIRREIEQRTGRELSISATYVTLERLETKGYVRSRVGEPTAERGGRRRKHFVLTAAGRKELAHARDDLTFFVRAINYLANPPARKVLGQ
jgi:DNA-binding PadR family transcriptional regulator